MLDGKYHPNIHGHGVQRIEKTIAPRKKARKPIKIGKVGTMIKCRQCGKEFNRMEGYVYGLYCSWHCLRQYQLKRVTKREQKEQARIKAELAGLK